MELPPRQAASPRAAPGPFETAVPAAGRRRIAADGLCDVREREREESEREEREREEREREGERRDELCDIL